MADARAQGGPAFLSSTIRIFDLSLGQMLWSRRSIFLGLVSAGPVMLALAVRLLVAFAPDSSLRFNINGTRLGGPAVFGVIVWLAYIRFIVPVLGVFYGTSLIADEVEDKTITYLFTRPIRRGAVLAGKYLAYLVCTTLLILPSVLLVYFLVVPIGGGSIGQEFPSLVVDLSMLATGLAAYGAVFALAGARLKRPLIVGLVFVFGWEPGVLLFPGYLKRATVAYYLQSLVPQAMPDDSAASLLLSAFREIPPAGVGLAALAVIIGGALWLAARTVERREYLLEQ